MDAEDFVPVSPERIDEQIKSVAATIFAGVGEMLVRKRMSEHPEVSMYQAALTEYNLLHGFLVENVLTDEHVHIGMKRS